MQELLCRWRLILISILSIEVRAELEVATRNVYETAGEIRSRLRGIEESLRPECKAKLGDTEYRIRRVQYETVLRSFSEIMNRYYLSQVSYRDAQKQLIRRELEISKEALRLHF